MSAAGRGAVVRHLGGNTERAGRALDRLKSSLGRRAAGQRGVEDRVRVKGGSFFDSVPSGGDAYVLKWIIHDWPMSRPWRSSVTSA